MKIKEIMLKAKCSNKSLLVPFIPIGDPNMEVSSSLFTGLQKSGIQLVEICVPYSDPIADGSTLVDSYDRALKTNITLIGVLKFLKKHRENGNTMGVILFSYLNPILSLGYEKFSELAKDSGVDSVLVVDLPFEESNHLRKYLKKQGIGIVHLISPTTSLERMKAIDASQPDFIY